MKNKAVFYSTSKKIGLTGLVIFLACFSEIKPITADTRSGNTIHADTLSDAWFGIKRKSAVYKYYDQRNFALSWFKQNQYTLTSLADSFLILLNDIRSRGLIPYHYHLAETEVFGKEFVLLNSRERIDLLLTDAFLVLVHDIRYGRLHHQTYSNDSAGIEILKNVKMHGKLARKIFEVEPAYPVYHALINSLEQMLDTIPDDSFILLKQGLFPLEMPGVHMIRTIDSNLERWRQETADITTFHVLVNIPSFTLVAAAGDSVYLTSAVVTGKKESPTPLLSSNIDCMVVYPYWYVPRKITVNEYLPFLKKDSLFLQRNRFDLLDQQGKLVDPLDVDFTQFTARTFPFTLRQREGTDNSLGVLKFVFDNPYAVYLHDTNSKGTFRRHSRAFSHGCVRVEKAQELGHLLRTRKINTLDITLSKALKNKTRASFTISPVPLYIRYYSVEATGASLVFYTDVYSLDKDMINSLYPAATLPKIL